MEPLGIIIVYGIILAICYGVIAWQVWLFRRKKMGFWSKLGVMLLGPIGMVLVQAFGHDRD